MTALPKLLTMALLATSVSAVADDWPLECAPKCAGTDQEGAHVQAPSPDNANHAKEAGFTGLHVYVEQDLFAKLFRRGGDQNYTMGVGIKATGSWFRHVGYPQHLIDHIFAIVPSKKDQTFHSLMMFGSAFTPDEILKKDPVKDDRPYAFLLALVSSRTWVDSTRGLKDHAITTELGLGFLGLGLGRDIQIWIHELLEADEPSGWKNQISDGGELTGFYRVGLRRRLTQSDENMKNFDASLDTDVWLGYYTNASLGTTVRLGSFFSHYYDFTSVPLAAGSSLVPHNGAPSSHGEFFVFGALRGRWVLYNALLQGGFKESRHVLPSSKISRGILELELGASIRVPVSKYLSGNATWVALAGRSPEFDTARSRWHWWGSIHLGITHRLE